MSTSSVEKLSIAEQISFVKRVDICLEFLDGIGDEYLKKILATHKFHDPSRVISSPLFCRECSVLLCERCKDNPPSPFEKKFDEYIKEIAGYIK